MAYNMQIDVVSLVNRSAFGVYVNEGDVVRILQSEDGSGILASMPAIKFEEDDYELYLPDEDFDKLLDWKPSTLAIANIYAKGERVKAYILPNGHATLVTNQNIKFRPDEYELIVPEDLYDSLLTQDN